jgi:hypothetical protein
MFCPGVQLHALRAVLDVSFSKRMVVAGAAGFMMMLVSDRLSSLWQKATLVVGTEVGLGIGVAVGALVAVAVAVELVCPEGLAAQAERTASAATSATATGAVPRQCNPERRRCFHQRDESGDIMGSPPEAG